MPDQASNAVHPVHSAACETLHVVLLRRDLRVDDQPALCRAAAAAAKANGQLLVCYVYDPSLLSHPTCSTAHFFFIDDCLAELESELRRRGSALFFRTGELVGVLDAFRLELDPSPMVLWSNHVVGIAAERFRDSQTAEWCARHSVEWHNLPSNGVLQQPERKGLDWHSEEFQGFWSQHVEEHCAADPESLPRSAERLPPPPEALQRGLRLSIDAISRLGASTAHGIARERCQRGGSRAGRELLRTFLQHRSIGYRSKLSSPVTAPSSCSRLSPHLAWGSLSLRQVHAALRARAASLRSDGDERNREWLVSIEGFRMRLHWRSHNMQKFEAKPHAETSNLVGGYDGMRDEAEQDDDALRKDRTLLHRFPDAGVDRGKATAQIDHVLSDATDRGGDGNDDDAKLGRDGGASQMLPPLAMAVCPETPAPADTCRRFEAWASGRTGYPLVDACMRCLDSTGWLTFRMRCMCVSFACYHLWLHWRRPAIWLARRFLDFEPGIHFMQMQMQAGCAEYVEMRVYNPIKQAQDQDPQGSFIRSWLPELRRVPLQYLHEPAKMPRAVQREAGCVIGVDYPRPLVEHAQAYSRAKHMLQERRNAMGMTRASPRAGVGAGARKRDFGAAGSADLRDLFAKKRARDAPPLPPSPTLVVDDVDTNHCGSLVVDAVADLEQRTRDQLAAAGFPPELARRAASAYPRNVERAADWILSSNDW